ncbi:MAG: hypothetical protein AAF432_15865 [Planctomycetota bacterium]
MNSQNPPPSSADGSPFVSNLADQLTPIQLTLSALADDVGHRLDSSPAPIEPLLDLWPLLTTSPVSRTVVFDPDTPADVLLDESRWSTGDINWSTSSVAVLDDAALRRALPLLGSRRTVIMVRLAGPLEGEDLRALHRAYAHGDSILEGDVRAEVAAVIRDGGIVRLESARKNVLFAAAGRMLQVHLSRVRRQPWADFGVPAPWQLERLFTVTGTLSVRPIETEVFTSFVDVGISTEEGVDAGPADRSLIYDLISGTWHDEP